MIIFSCNNSDKTSSKDVNPENVFLDYKISGEGGNDFVTCMFQFKYGGANGTSLVLDEPAKVQLDGETLQADSTNFTGAYYEVQKPLDEFGGKHTISFFASDNKVYSEIFEFSPFSLAEELPKSVERKDIIMRLHGLKPLDHLIVIITDTAFTSNDVHEIDTVRDGTLIIEASQLQDIVGGPVVVQLIKEEVQPVKKGTRAGGRISISYGLKREIELKD
ncbi:MAG: hypothetical protein ICV66_08185 [Chitinophagaceae bacterium]|nr:hypothetical protein [Chitinophagaceae bacterium]